MFVHHKICQKCNNSQVIRSYCLWRLLFMTCWNCKQCSWTMKQNFSCIYHCQKQNFASTICLQNRYTQTKQIYINGNAISFAKMSRCEMNTKGGDQWANYWFPKFLFFNIIKACCKFVGVNVALTLHKASIIGKHFIANNKY